MDVPPIQPPHVISIDGKQYSLLKLGRPLHASVATARLINSTHFHIEDLTIVGDASEGTAGGGHHFVIWCTLTADQKIVSPDLMNAVIECSKADGCLPPAPPHNMVQITLPDGRLATVPVLPPQAAEPKRGRRPGAPKRKQPEVLTMTAEQVRTWSCGKDHIIQLVGTSEGIGTELPPTYASPL